MLNSPAIAVVTRETRMQGLLARWGTKGAAKFRLRAAREHQRMQLAAAPAAPPAAATPVGTAKVQSWNSLTNQRHSTSTTSQGSLDAELAADFDEYEAEENAFHSTMGRLNDELNLGFPVTHVPRDFVANYDFQACLAVVVVGQDGLVANVAKYVKSVPIIAVNPDPQRFDGVLLPFRADDVRKTIQLLLKGHAKIREVTLAEVELNDGQRLLAFNDLFVGCNGHASARYVLGANGRSESQSSSGVIISTGAGSTGWLSSIFNMYSGISQWLGGTATDALKMAWEDPRLAWVVREPFRSMQSGATLCAGLLKDGDQLTIESVMPSRGVIFSDGIESDFLEFSSGTIARIRRASQRARLVIGG